MDGPTEAELDEMLAIGLSRAGWSWRTPWRRHRVHLPVQGPTINGRTWMGRPDEHGWTYTARQARQMRRELARWFLVRERDIEDILTKLLYH